MPNLDFPDWLFLGGPVLLLIGAIVLLKVSYTAKRFVPLPPTKPAFCLLPKYTFTIPIQGTNAEADLAAILVQFGFREPQRDATAIVFTRGSALGDFSVKIAKLVVTASLPVSHPVELKIEYGVVVGCAFDTGDLWKFCNELIEKVEASMDRQEFKAVETGNPYQSPRA